MSHRVACDGILSGLLFIRCVLFRDSVERLFFNACRIVRGLAAGGLARARVEEVASDDEEEQSGEEGDDSDSGKPKIKRVDLPPPSQTN